MDQPTRPPNRFLRSLSNSDFELLRPQLRIIKFTQGATLFEPGAAIRQLYFPLSGLVSVIIGLETGGAVETGMIGSDSVVGAAAAFGSTAPFFRAVVQIPGEAAIATVAAAQAAVNASASFRKALYCHDQILAAQAQQSVACASKHHTEERLCRWLLRIRNLTQSDHIPLTQEYLAQMMGVRRTSVTIVAHSLQAAKLIKYRRGQIEILDPRAIEEASCECHTAIQEIEEKLFGMARAPNAPSELVRTLPTMQDSIRSS